MAILLIILFVTLALAVRAAVGRRFLGPAGSQAVDDTGLADSFARTFALVLMSLIGLFALGVTNGNVLGAGTP
jgi:hypothetical protein